MCFQAQKQNTTCLIYKIKQNKRYWAVLSTTAESSLNNGVIIELLKKQTLPVRVRSVCPAPSAWKLCQLGFVTHIAQCWVFFYSCCYFAALATPAVRRWVACSAGPHNIHSSSKAPGSRAWFFTSCLTLCSKWNLHSFLWNAASWRRTEINQSSINHSISRHQTRISWWR